MRKSADLQAFMTRKRITRRTTMLAGKEEPSRRELVAYLRSIGEEYAEGTHRIADALNKIACELKAQRSRKRGR